MTLALETQIVASSFNRLTRLHTYTVRWNGRNWTTSVPDDDFSRLPGKAQRRAYLATRLSAAMQGPCDA